MASQDTTNADRAKAERVTKGGATFSPRLPERPDYSKFAGEVFLQTLVKKIRGPSLAVLAVVLMNKPWRRLSKFMLEKLGLSERLWFALALTGTHAAIYLPMNLFFYYVEKNGWLKEYKMNYTPGQEPSEKLVNKTWSEIPQNLVGEFVFLLGSYSVYLKCGGRSALAPLDSNVKMYFQFLINLVGNEMLFYWTHRVFHAKQLYTAKYTNHKLHHQFVATKGVAVHASDLLEDVLSGAVPSFAPALLGGVHPLAFVIWHFWRITETVEAHCGYCFKGSWLQKIGLTNSVSSSFHASHHSVNRGCFGFPYTDFIFGTMDHWIANGGEDGYLVHTKHGKTLERLEKKSSPTAKR